MNKRIEELAEQAGIPSLWTVGTDKQGNPILEKFAELLIKECISIVEDAVNHREPASTYVDKIKEHFGVESTSIKVGSRVKVVSGFNVGAKGTVSYIEPTGRMWVMRDGASTDVFYTPDEVVRIEQ